MSDGEPRLLVGTPTKSAGQITLLAETSEVDIYEKEMTAAHETSQGDKIQPVASKRPADSMVLRRHPKSFWFSDVGIFVLVSKMLASCWPGFAFLMLSAIQMSVP